MRSPEAMEAQRSGSPDMYRTSLVSFLHHGPIKHVPSGHVEVIFSCEDVGGFESNSDVPNFAEPGKGGSREKGAQGLYCLWCVVSCLGGIKKLTSGFATGVIPTTGCKQPWSVAGCSCLLRYLPHLGQYTQELLAHVGAYCGWVARWITIPYLFFRVSCHVFVLMCFFARTRWDHWGFFARHRNVPRCLPTGKVDMRFD